MTALYGERGWGRRRGVDALINNFHFDSWRFKRERKQGMDNMLAQVCVCVCVYFPRDNTSTRSKYTRRDTDMSVCDMCECVNGKIKLISSLLSLRDFIMTISSTVLEVKDVTH